MAEIIFEHIIERDNNPLFRIAYPVDYKGREYLVIQKRKKWHTEWRGGLFIPVADSDDIGIVNEIIEGTMSVLAAGGWPLEYLEEQ